jgi:hypothetical protein
VYGSTSGLPKEHYLVLIEKYVGQLLGQFSFTDKHFMMLVLGTVFLIWMFLLLQRTNIKLIGAAIVVFVSLNISVAYSNFFPILETKSLREEPKTAQFLKQDKGEWRYFTIMPGFTTFEESVKCTNTFAENFELQKELLQPNVNMLYGVDAVDGYDNFMPKGISELLAYIGSEQSVTGNLLANENISIEERIRKIAERKGLLKMMNVKYVISTREIADKDFVEVYRDKVGRCETPLLVYELKGVWPRYFTSRNTAKYSDFQSVIQSDLSVPIIMGEDLEPKSEKNFEEVKPEYLYDGLLFKTNQKENNNLYIGNAFLPNYKAFLDDKEVLLKKANHAYMYVPVPPGKHEVRIIYNVPVK